jgi:hypothetical protein
LQYFQFFQFCFLLVNRNCSSKGLFLLLCIQLFQVRLKLFSLGLSLRIRILFGEGRDVLITQIVILNRIFPCLRAAKRQAL